MDCRGECARAWQRKGISVLLRAQRARAVPKKKGRLGSRPLQLPKIWVNADDEDLLVRQRVEVWHEDRFDERKRGSPGGRTEGRAATRRPNGPLREAGPTTAV